jgi:hypothetical protein
MKTERRGVHEALRNLRRQAYKRENATVMGLIPDEASQFIGLMEGLEDTILDKLSGLEVDTVVVSQEGDEATFADLAFSDGSIGSISFEKGESDMVIFVTVGEEAYEISAPFGEDGELDPDAIPWEDIISLFSKTVAPEVQSEELKAFMRGGKIELRKVPRTKKRLTYEQRRELKETRKMARRIAKRLGKNKMSVRSLREALLKARRDELIESDNWSFFERGIKPILSSDKWEEFRQAMDNPSSSDKVSVIHAYYVLSDIVDQSQMQKINIFYDNNDFASESCIKCRCLTTRKHEGENSQAPWKYIKSGCGNDVAGKVSSILSGAGFTEALKRKISCRRFRRYEEVESCVWDKVDAYLRPALGGAAFNSLASKMGDPDNNDSISTIRIYKALDELDITPAVKDDCKAIFDANDWVKKESHARTRVSAGGYEAYGRDSGGKVTWWDIRETLHRAYITNALTGQIEQHLHIANIDSEVSAVEVIRAAKEIFGDNVAGKVKDALEKGGYNESHARGAGRRGRYEELRERYKKLRMRSEKDKDDKDDKEDDTDDFHRLGAGDCSTKESRRRNRF